MLFDQQHFNRIKEGKTMKHTTKIISNGSKWAGQEPDSIDELCEVLQTYCLDPTFEAYGSFIICLDNEPQIGAPPATTRFWGNFLTLSHVFCIDTNNPKIINRLTALIRNNQKREDYRAEIKSMEQAAQDIENMEKKQEIDRLAALKAQRAEITQAIAAAEGTL